uniref:Tetraspanin n=1 Tax=Mesocestoides corti TaxID=53468 RepID=A0A5K3FL18_MESCO
MEPENIQMQSNKSRASRLYATAVSRLKLGWLQTTAVVLNTMTICVFWWCIVVGTVLSFILNNIIEAPRYRFTGLPVLIFMTGSLGLIVCLAGLKCIKGRGHFGLITYVASLGLMALFVLTVAVELLLLTLRPRQVGGTNDYFQSYTTLGDGLSNILNTRPRVQLLLWKLIALTINTAFYLHTPKLHEWIDTSLKEVFAKGAATIQDMEAVFLLENQVS